MVRNAFLFYIYIFASYHPTFLVLVSHINLTQSFLPIGEDVVFIANDWHTAALPCYLKSMYKPHGIYRSAKVFVTLLFLFCS